MTGRPGRPGRPASVSREQVIDAAVLLAERVGLDRFTMAQLASELGVAPMTAYHHVSSRDELAGLVVERLLERVEVPGPDDGPWDAQLKQLQANVRRQLGRVGGIAAGLEPDVASASGRLSDAVLAILDRAGFDERSALLAYGAMFTYMIGQLGLDIASRADDDTTDGARFTELTKQNAGGHRPDPDEFFDFGFDLLLAGLREVLGADDRSRGGGP